MTWLVSHWQSEITSGAWLMSKWKSYSTTGFFISHWKSATTHQAAEMISHWKSCSSGITQAYYEMFRVITP